MKDYKKKIEPSIIAPKVDDEEDEKIDIHSMEITVERLEAGLIGTLRIEDDCNRPLLKKGDLVHLRYPQKLQIKDMVLYRANESYYLRRIIKTKEDDIYVAGDNEKEYRIIKKEDVIGRVVSRERNNKMLSFSLAPKKKFYTFKKVKLAYWRLGNRVINLEQDITNESLELAAQSIDNKTLFENKTEIKTNLDLDSDLASFLNPDTLVLELRGANDAKNSANNNQQQHAKMIEEIIEEVEYVEVAEEESEEVEIVYEEVETEYQVEEATEEVIEEIVDNSVVDDLQG